MKIFACITVRGRGFHILFATYYIDLQVIADGVGITTQKITLLHSVSLNTEVVAYIIYDTS